VLPHAQLNQLQSPLRTPSPSCMRFIRKVSHPTSQESTPATALRGSDPSRCLSQRQNGQSGGFHPGTYEMLPGADFCSPQAINKFTVFSNAIRTFVVPNTHSLFDSKGVAFTKPSSQNVRSISIIEAWLSPAFSVTLAFLEDAGADRAPEKQGVGVPCGAGSIGYSLMFTLADDQKHTVVDSHDLANAYDTLSRQSIFNTLADPYSSLIPFVNLLYGRPSTVHLSSADPASKHSDHILCRRAAGGSVVPIPLRACITWPA
jgi:hypothetical protein